jgi:putative peptidoglycan lipid II flippase
VGHAAAWGVSASGVVQLALLVWAVGRAGMPVRIPRPRLNPRMKMLLRRMAPGLIGASATQLNQVVDVIIASLLPAGTVSLLYYADRVQQLPLGVIGTAVGTALLPMLSRQVRGGEAAASLGTLNRAIEYALFLTLPATLALAVSAFPIMWTLFGRGAFDMESARLSAQSLTAYAAGLPAVVLLRVLAPAFFARGDTATPVRIGLVTLALNFALNLALMVPLQHIGPPLATSLAAIFNMGCLAVTLMRRGFLVPDTALRRRLPRMLLAALAMAVTLWFTEDPIFAHAYDHHGTKVFALAMLVGLGCGVYIAAAHLLGAFDLRDVLGLLRRRRLRRTRGSAISPAPTAET